MKKFISVFLFVCMLLGCASVTAGAISINEGKDALAARFPDGKCPGGLDYVYFTPEGASETDTKYPLVVFLHGNSSGTEPRKQLNSYNFPIWSSDEYQARFKDTNGAFLLLPRSNEADNSWYPHSSTVLKKTIDYFISVNKDSIDTSRIYIMGLSAGGSMVNFMTGYYPGFFAASIPMCAIYQPTATEIEQSKDLSVWIFCSDDDYYASANTASSNVTFKSLSIISNHPENIRMTNLSKVIYADGTYPTGNKREHYVWDCAIYDLHMADGTPYLYATSKDATGKKLSFDNQEGGLIDWLYRQKLPEEEPVKKSFFDRIADWINSIIDFFRILFGIK